MTSVRWVQILKLPRLGHALAVGYPREGGGWEIIETEDRSVPVGFYPETMAVPYLAPGARTQVGVLVCLFPGQFGWVAIHRDAGGQVLLDRNGVVLTTDPFILEPETRKVRR